MFKFVRYGGNRAFYYEKERNKKTVFLYTKEKISADTTHVAIKLSAVDTILYSKKVLRYRSD